MKTTPRFLAIFIGVLCLASTASAHYLWITLAGRSTCAGPRGLKKNQKTDKKGVVRFKAEAEGQYLFRTSVDEKASGTDGGKEYQLKRYHATLVMNLPLEK